MRCGLWVVLLAMATLDTIERRAEAAMAATSVHLLGFCAVGAEFTPWDAEP